MATLREVIAHYAAGGRNPRPKSDKVRGFTILPSETDDLVAFLESLTDYRFLTNPELSNPLSNPDMREELKKGERTKSDPPEWLKGH
jgi:cytochrome c peroxidase